LALAPKVSELISIIAPVFPFISFKKGNIKLVLPTFLWVKIRYSDEPFSHLASGGFIVYEAN